MLRQIMQWLEKEAQNDEQEKLENELVAFEFHT